MIIEIPDDNSIVKWKMNDKDEWKSAEISDLIIAYEGRLKGDSISRSVLKEAIYDTDFDFGDYYDNTEKIRERVCTAIDNAQAVEDRYSEGYAQGYIDGSTGADWRGDTE